MEKAQSVFNVAGKYGSYNIVDGDVVFEYPDEVSISHEDLWKEIDADWVIWQSQEYARKRQAAYDSIGNQLDMIYKDNLNGTTTHKASVEAVKAKYPKP